MMFDGSLVRQQPTSSSRSSRTSAIPPAAESQTENMCRTANRRREPCLPRSLGDTKGKQSEPPLAAPATRRRSTDNWWERFAPLDSPCCNGGDALVRAARRVRIPELFAIAVAGSLLACWPFTASGTSTSKPSRFNSACARSTKASVSFCLVRKGSAVSVSLWLFRFSGLLRALPCRVCGERAFLALCACMASVRAWFPR